MLADAVAQRTPELGLAPQADAELLVGRDVGRPELAERRVESESARRRGTGAVARMAAAAVAGLEQVFAARDRGRIGGLRAGHGAREPGSDEPS